MRVVKASEFKAKCLKLMDEVAASGETILVTKNGKPVATLGPVKQPSEKLVYGMDLGKIEILGDIISPIPGAWDLSPSKLKRRY